MVENVNPTDRPGPQSPKPTENTALTAADQEADRQEAGAGPGKWEKAVRTVAATAAVYIGSLISVHESRDATPTQNSDRAEYVQKAKTEVSAQVGDKSSEADAEGVDEEGIKEDGQHFMEAVVEAKKKRDEVEGDG